PNLRWPTLPLSSAGGRLAAAAEKANRIADSPATAQEHPSGTLRRLRRRGHSQDPQSAIATASCSVSAGSAGVAILLTPVFYAYRTSCLRDRDGRSNSLALAGVLDRPDAVLHAARNGFAPADADESVQPVVLRRACLEHRIDVEVVLV